MTPPTRTTKPRKRVGKPKDLLDDCLRLRLSLPYAVYPIQISQFCVRLKQAERFHKKLGKMIAFVKQEMDRK